MLPSNDLHIVVDALFATKETIATASAHDVRVTWSQNCQHKKKLFAVLSDGLPKRSWRMACVPGSEGELDQHFFVFNDSKSMMGGSTAFQLQDTSDAGLSRKGCTPEIARDLSKLSKESLTWLVSQIADASLQSCGASEASMVSHVTGISVMHWNKTHPWVGKRVEVV